MHSYTSLRNLHEFKLLARKSCPMIPFYEHTSETKYGEYIGEGGLPVRFS